MRCDIVQQINRLSQVIAGNDHREHDADRMVLRHVDDGAELCAKQLRLSEREPQAA